MMNACTISNLHALMVKGGSLIEASDMCRSFDPSPLQNSRSSFVRLGEDDAGRTRIYLFILLAINFLFYFKPSYLIQLIVFFCKT